MNKTGWQQQVIGDAQRQLLRLTWPWCYKQLNTGKSLDLAAEWRAHRPDGILVLRLVTNDNEPLSDLPDLTDRAIREFDGFQHVAGTGKVVLEVPVNERFQTTPEDFAALAVASLSAARQIIAAGFTPGVLITSEGNPPGDDFGAPFFLQGVVLNAMREFRRMGAVWCPHGYSHPPAASDEPYHSTRPSFILAQLPEDARLNYLYGEDGCDGGTDQPNGKPGVGWRGYFPGEREYRDWMSAKRQAIANDPLCVGSAMFLSGSYAMWDSFDVGDSVDIRPYFTEDVPGPAIQWQGEEPPMLYGIDVSNNQGIIDWDAVAAAVPKISFAFLKMSGDERGQTDTMFIDDTFPRNLNECLRVGIVPFGYHFSNPDIASPVSAIATMKVSLARVGGLSSGCGLMVDAEVGNGDHLVWHAELDAAIQTTFQVPATVLYTAHWFAGPHNLEDHAPSLGDEPLYVADYTASGQPDRTPTVLPGWDKVSFWQYTDRGSVPGVSGWCDRDVFFGTEDELRALCKPADAPVPPVAVVDERVDAFNNLWSLTLDQRWTEERRRSAQRAIIVLKKAEGLE